MPATYCLSTYFLPIMEKLLWMTDLHLLQSPADFGPGAGFLVPLSSLPSSTSSRDQVRVM